MMMLLKVSRAKVGNHRDSYVDIVGYVECVDKLLAMDEGCRDFFTKIATDTPKVSVQGA